MRRCRGDVFKLLLFLKFNTMKKIVIAAMAVAIIAGFSSCQKPCTRQITKPDGTQVVEEYNCNQSANNSGCTTCPTGQQVTYYTPTGTGFTPSQSIVQLTGYIANNPGDMYGDDFQNRCEDHNSYAVALFDQNGYVVGNGSFGVETNYMSTWVYVPGYGYGEAAVDGNRMSQYGTELHVGSSVSVSISLDPTKPFALKMNPHNVVKGTNISQYSGQKQPIYMQVQ